MNPDAHEPKNAVKRESRHVRLLKNAKVALWYRQARRGSESTAQVRLAVIGRFLEQHQMTPTKLFALKADGITELVDEFVEQNAAKPNVVRETVKAVKSLLAANGMVFSRKIKLPRARIITEQRIITQDELRSVLAGANLRARVAIVLLAQSGQRLEVLGDGKDGLRLEDIVDLEVKDGNISWKHIPARFIVRDTLSKTGIPYFSFLSNEAVQYVEAYLRARMLHGEHLTPRSVLIGPVKTNGWHGKLTEKFEGGTQPISRANISDAIRTAMRRAAVNERPYALRSFFASQAARCRQLSPDVREFLMGHNSGISKTYTLNKRLPEETIEEMRSAYAKSLPLLETVEHETLLRVNALDQKVVGMLKALGISGEDFDALDAEDIERLTRMAINGWTKGAKEQEVFAERLKVTMEDVMAREAALVEKEQGAKPVQRMVSKKQLTAALAAGARVVAKVDEDQFVVEGGE